MATTAKKKKPSSTNGMKRGTASSAGRNASRKTGTSVRRKDTKRVAARKRSFVRSETAAVVAVAFGLVLLLVNLGLLGSLGESILAFEKGLFGQASFLLPFAVAGAALIAYLEKGSYLRPHKLVCTGVLLVLISAILHLMFGGDALAGGGNASLSPVELYRLGADGHEGGGMIGGLIANALRSVIGYAGAYLVLIALLVICVVVITEKSFINVARIGAQKTAGVVRSGAGRTLEAARSGREMAVQRHKENMIRRDAMREAERLRKLEESFEPIPDSRNLSAVTLDGQAAAADADMYANYGRDIIGDVQPGTADLADIREPFMKPRVDIRPAGTDMNYDTQVIRDVFRPEERKPAAAVRVKQINEDADDVPFDEPEDETYKSYANMLNKGQVRLEDARMAGYAVSRGGVPAAAAWAKAAVSEPQFLDAFRPAPEESAAADVTAVEASAVVSSDVPEDDYVNEGFSAEDLAKASDEIGQELAASGIHDSWIREMKEGIPGSGADIADGAIPAEAGDFEVSYAEGHEPADTVYAGNYSPETMKTGASSADDGSDDELSPAEESWLTGSGRQMEAPDRYEAERIMREKRGDRSKASESRKEGAGGRYAGRAETKKASGPAGGEAAPQNTPAKAAVREKPKPKPKPYVFPPNSLLERSVSNNRSSRDEVMQNARKLEQVLKDFGVGVTVTAVTRGPRVSRYEMTPDTGVKVSRITSLEGDIKLALAAREIRIEAPIPGKSAVGIEVPNEESQTVKFRDILESEEFKSAKSKLSWGIGLDIQGRPVVGNIAKMPHLLVAGTTGSGKSVGINSLIMSILYRATPEEVRMILIDPKVVELSVYNGIPHLLTDVVTKPERAVSALNWAVSEMNNRYKLFQTSGTRNISGYNEKVIEVNAELDRREAAGEEITENRPQKLPFILIVIDELAELMMHSKKDIESSIVSLTQLARAAGIHLVVATQRPSVDVITGLIKSNIPSRIAYRLPSQMDSRTILDTGGAETLLGNGDMLYKPGDKNNPERIQGAFLSDNEVEAVVEFLRKHNQQNTDTEVEAAIARQTADGSGEASGQGEEAHKSDRDEYFENAGRLIITTGKASIGALQRKFKIGFNRAARIMDDLHEMGVVSDGEGTKERQILMTMEEFETRISS